MRAQPKAAQSQPSYWTLIRDVAVLQVKLLIDGFRDLVLLPASLIAGLVSLANSHHGQPGPQFYRLIAVGKRSEIWINLFGAMKNSPERFDEEMSYGDTNVNDLDDIVARVETFVVEEYQRGGVSEQAKTRIDKALAALQRGSRKSP